MPTLILLLALSATPDSSPLTIQPKARAFFIETASVTGAAMVRPQDHVDVIAVVADPEAKQASSFVLMQNVLVLANAAPGGGSPAHLALLVLPEEARLLSLIKVTGQLVVVQRNPNDNTVLEGQARDTLKSAIPKGR